MKDVICIYAQRADDDEVWEEANAIESCYTGNTIAIIEDENGLKSYDFSGCNTVDEIALHTFFMSIGVSLGEDEPLDHPEPPVKPLCSIWNLMQGHRPNLN